MASDNRQASNSTAGGGGLNGFVPSASNTFTLLNAAGGIFGVFSNVTTGQRLTTVDGIGSFVVNYGPGSGFNQSQIVLSAFESLSPMLPGDYNQDGVVDSADYVVWRNGLGTTHTQNDYTIWRAYFGQTSGSSASTTAGTSSAPIPEPDALLMILMGMILMFICQRRAAS